MKIASRIAATRQTLRDAPQPVIFVPTMGALHAGHAALIRRARRIAGRQGTVAVSIFVNPTQFGPGEDLANYPRPTRRDAALCRREGVDLLFRPTGPNEIHPPGHSIIVEETALSRTLCGASRPGHFAGVCTVVAKLFAILGPDAAVFGEKDWQQLAIVRRLVRDLHLPIRIIGEPTVREPDGLALSSRNVYLTREERAGAPGFHRALQTALARQSPRGIESAAARAIERIPGATLDYAAVVDAETLAPIHRLDRPARLAAAIFLGKTRLIDNVSVPDRA